MSTSSCNVRTSAIATTYGGTSATKSASTVFDAIPVDSWVDIPPDSDFSLANIPFGIFSVSAIATTSTFTSTLTSTSYTSVATKAHRPRCGTAIGDYVIDLSLLAEAGLFDQVFSAARVYFSKSTWNDFMALPKNIWMDVRNRIIQLFAKTNHELQSNIILRNASMYQTNDQTILITMHMPVTIGDYTDFYSSKAHAINVGTMFRSKEHALQPNWLHLPVGYHGRSSTVSVANQTQTPTAFHRPCGQIELQQQEQQQTANTKIIHGPCQKLDFELEVAFFVGGETFKQGNTAATLTIQQAQERIFGFVIMNDWSARDVQKWEYVPLGPFTSKNFHTTISPWIVTTMALEPHRVKTPPSSCHHGADGTSLTMMQQDPTPLSYLQDSQRLTSYDISLQVAIQTSSSSSSTSSTTISQPITICRSNYSHLYWTAAQQLVHHTVSGCIMRPGDLLASGTISGTAPDSYGSLLELTWNGTKPIVLNHDTGETRTWLQDGDTVIMSGCTNGPPHARVGFGICSGTVLPALQQHVQSDSISNQQSITTLSGSSSLPPPQQQAHTRYTNLKLYGFWRSSSTWRVRIALEAKSIPYEEIMIDLDQQQHSSHDFTTSKNPMAQVPVLEFKIHGLIGQTSHGTTTTTTSTRRISQSVAILEFLEEAFPHTTPLLPLHDPLDRALVRQIVQIVNSGIQPLQNLAFLKDLEKQSGGTIASQQEGAKHIIKGLNAIQDLIIATNPTTATNALPNPYKFCLDGFSPTMADVVLIPQLMNAKTVYQLKVKELFPVLAEIEESCLQHSWFSKTHPQNILLQAKNTMQ